MLKYALHHSFVEIYGSYVIISTNFDKGVKNLLFYLILLNFNRIKF